jgi:hypothetical protein
MKFVYQTEEREPYNFNRLGSYLKPDMTVELTDAAYKQFRLETENTTHTLILTKESAL